MLRKISLLVIVVSFFFCVLNAQVSISSPTDGANFPVGTDITVVGSTVGDWTINYPGGTETVPGVQSFPTGELTITGSYTFTLTVGGSSASVTITISANQAPTAVASATPTSGNAPLTVNFTGSNSTDSDGTIATYSWSFDDGNSASTANPSHTYNNAGNYTATLTVTDDGGATGTAQVTITVIASSSSWSSSGSDIYFDGGNVGIGTQTPSAKLDVNGQLVGGIGATATSGVLDWNDISNTRSGSGYTLLRGDDTNGPVSSSLYFHPFNFEYSSKNGNGNITQLAIPYGGGNAVNLGMYMRGRYSGAWTDWTRVISENLNGNVGIGTTTPNSRLEVAGTIHSTSGGVKFPDGTIQTTAFLNNLIVWASNGNDINYTTGNVGIGTSNPQSKLAVNGTITTKEIIVTLDNWSDFVFENDYKIMTISELSQYIQKNRHLPDIPTEKDVQKEGVSIGKMQTLLLQKIEELTLHIIEQEKESLNWKVKILCQRKINKDLRY